MRSCVYNKNGEHIFVETTAERDKLYATGDWFDSPSAAKDAAKKDMEETDRKIKQNEEAQKKLADEAALKAQQEDEAKRLAAQSKASNKTDAK